MGVSTISATPGTHSAAPESATALRLPGGRDGRDPERAIKRGPSRVPREFVLATQRDRLYDGLVRTVAAHGYANATVTEICRAAGVTRPAFYEHFDGKEAAFLAAYSHGTDLLLEALEHAYRKLAADWRTAVWRHLEILLDILAGTPEFATAAIVEIEAVGPEARRKRAELLYRFRGFFAGAPALPAGVDRTALIDTVIGGVYASIYQRIASGDAEGLPDLLPALGYFVLVPFGLAAPAVSAVPATPQRSFATASEVAQQQRAALPCMPLFLTPEQS